MNKRLLPLLAFIAASPLVPSALAKEKARDALTLIPEQTYKLGPMEVKTNPFAYWGIHTLAQGSLLMRLGGWYGKNQAQANGSAVTDVKAETAAVPSAVALIRP